MHTSTVLKASDFEYWALDANTSMSIDFETFCPNYHEQDRVAVVSPQPGDGVRHAAYAILALTTAFYDRLRSRGHDFFDYPQHFAFIGENENGQLPLDKAVIGGSWGHLDVWPDSNWLPVPMTVPRLIKTVFGAHIHRLFWPARFTPQPDDESLPDYVRKMLKSRLKAVYYYDSTHSNVGIRVTQRAKEIVDKSLDQLPDNHGEKLHLRLAKDGIEWYRRVEVDEFLENLTLATIA